MRRRDKARDATEAWDLFREAPTVQLATTTAQGVPVLRTLHGVVHDGAIVVHGSVKGEKLEGLGRPAVVAAHELLAEVPSHWLDPQRACPATSLYRSAMAHGTLTELQDKGPALQALMQRFQPEGGHHPFAVDGFYERALRGVRLLQVRPDRVSAKAALGQGKPEAWRNAVAAGLWRTGQLRGLRAMLDAQPVERWAGLQPVMTEAEVAGAVALLKDTYWNQGLDPAVIARAQLASPAWVGAVHQGQVIGTARAITDGSKLAYVMDVAVAPDHQGRGVGRSLMQLLLDHPAVRDCRRIELHTKTAGPFYQRLGFQPAVDPAWRSAWRVVRSTAPA